MRSLRTTLLLGLAAIAVAITGGLAGVVFARAHRQARDATEARLKFHAEALAGLLEVGRDGIEFEAKPDGLPGFGKDAKGAYAAIHGPDGKVIVRSPSLGKGALPPPPAWEPGLLRFEEFAAGPDGLPCTLVTMAFIGHLEDAEPGEAAGWTPPPEEARRFRIQVALDSSERDLALRDLAWFLGLAGAAAVAAAVGAGLLLARLVLEPVHRMTAEAAALTPEDTGRRLHPGTVVRELHSLAGTLNSALDRLADALERQRRFTTEASHELRTPVSVLMAESELLLRRPRTEAEYRAGLERQLRTVRRMRGIVEDLLALARADAAATEMEREPVRLDRVLDSVCDEHGALAEARGIRLVREVEPGVLATGSGRFLARAVANLLSNAIKFTPDGGTVTARLAEGPGGAEISVSDTGPGIPPAQRERVFERFYRVGEGRDPAEGAGLGLAIVSWVVREHGGTVTVDGAPGEGATFRIRLPAGPRPAPVQDPARSGV